VAAVGAKRRGPRDADVNLRAPLVAHPPAPSPQPGARPRGFAVEDRLTIGPVSHRRGHDEAEVDPTPARGDQRIDVESTVQPTWASITESSTRAASAEGRTRWR
jgi:hypothetical protein